MFSLLLLFCAPATSSLTGSNTTDLPVNHYFGGQTFSFPAYDHARDILVTESCTLAFCDDTNLCFTAAHCRCAAVDVESGPTITTTNPVSQNQGIPDSLQFEIEFKEEFNDDCAQVHGVFDWPPFPQRIQTQDPLHPDTFISSVKKLNLTVALRGNSPQFAFPVYLACWFGQPQTDKFLWRWGLVEDVRLIKKEKELDCYGPTNDMFGYNVTLHGWAGTCKNGNGTYSICHLPEFGIPTEGGLRGCSGSAWFGLNSNNTIDYWTGQFLGLESHGSDINGKVTSFAARTEPHNKTNCPQMPTLFTAKPEYW